MPEDNPIYNLWFSEKACNMIGYILYRTIDNKEVIVTAIYLPGKEDHYLWGDKVCVGQAYKDGFIRSYKARY
jgi:hypothetical protein